MRDRLEKKEENNFSLDNDRSIASVNYQMTTIKQYFKISKVILKQKKLDFTKNYGKIDNTQYAAHKINQRLHEAEEIIIPSII